MRYLRASALLALAAAGGIAFGWALTLAADRVAPADVPYLVAYIVVAGSH